MMITDAIAFTATYLLPKDLSVVIEALGFLCSNSYSRDSYLNWVNLEWQQRSLLPDRDQLSSFSDGCVTICTGGRLIIMSSSADHPYLARPLMCIINQWLSWFLLPHQNVQWYLASKGSKFISECYNSRTAFMYYSVCQLYNCALGFGVSRVTLQTQGLLNPC